MQAPNFIYRKNKRSSKKERRSSHLARLGILFFCCGLGLLLANSCRPDTLWNQALKEVQIKLKEADYSFLKQLDENQANHQYNLQEIFRLGPNAPFYFYFIFKDLDKNELAEKSLRLMLDKPTRDGQSPLNRWQEESWQLLVEMLLAEKRYAEAEKWADAYLERPGLSAASPGTTNATNASQVTGVSAPSASEAKMRKSYLEALYRQEKDVELLAAIKRYYPVYNQDPQTLTAADARFKYEEHPELLLYWAVASCRTNQENWPDTFRELFLNVNLPDLHLRTYKFLINDPAKQVYFKPEVWDLLTGKYNILNGERQKGIPLLEKTLEGLLPNQLAGTKIIKELAFAYLNTGAYSQGIRFFDSLLSRFASFAWPATHPRVMEAREMEARLYRGKRFYEQASSLLREVASVTPDKKQKDRCLWFILDMQIKLAPAKGLAELKTSLAQWNDLSYFYDLLDELTHALTVKRAWSSVNELYQALSTRADADLSPPAQELLDRLYYLIDHYYNSNPKTKGLPLTKRHQSAPENNYYALLTAYQQNKLQNFFADREFLAADLNEALPRPTEQLQDALDGQDDQESPATPRSDADEAFPIDNSQASASATPPAGNLPEPAVTVTSAALTEEETYVKDFFDYGLFNEGFIAASGAIRSIRLSLLLEIAETLRDKRCYYQSINLAYYYLARKDTPPTVADYCLIYPRGYDEQIEPLAKEWGLPAWLLYTLVWSESAFKPSVKSPAGAVGLAQLMPSTALEMARRLKLAEPDLTNPAHNLRLGTYYYAQLYRNYESALKAFMAYNAGPARVRKWVKEFARYPAELFTEVLPIAETRKYIRKIIHTAVLYAYLYNQQAPAEVIHSFYPSLPLPTLPTTSLKPSTAPAVPDKQLTNR